jgi:hypothetical protein
MTRAQQIVFINFINKFNGEERYPGDGVAEERRRRIIGSCAILFDEMMNKFAPEDELERLGLYASGVKNGPFDVEKAFEDLNIKELCSKYGYKAFK